MIEAGRETAAETGGGADPLVMGVRDRWDAHGLQGEPWPFMAICSVARLHQLLKKALDDELKRLEISRTGYFLLTALALTPRGSARLSTLGRFLMMHPTTVKLTVDQLEAAGLVGRTRHPRDRRATLVEITADGRERVNEVGAALEAPGSAFAPFAGMHRELFEALQPARLAAGDVEPVEPAEPAASGASGASGGERPGAEGPGAEGAGAEGAGAEGPGGEGAGAEGPDAEGPGARRR